MAARRYIFGLFIAVTWLVAAVILLSTHDGDSEGRFPRDHAAVACSECHIATASVEAVGGMPDFNRACRGCHAGFASSSIGFRLNFHSGADLNCTRCHSFHNVEEITAGSSEFAYSFENSRQRSQCYACHGGRESLSTLSTGHRKAAELFHSDYRYSGGLSVSDACLVCHSTNQSRQFTAIDRGGAPTFEFHGSHPVGIEVRPGAGKPGNWIRSEIDSRLVLMNGRLECTTCHSLSAKTNFHLTGFTSRDELCRGCHRLDGNPVQP